MTINPTTLERAGIHVSPEEFEQLVIAAVRQVSPTRLGEPGRDLTPEQAAALRRGGIDPLSASPETMGPTGPLARGAAMYAAMLATSLTVTETARRLGVDESRVRQRIRARTLYAIKAGTAWRVPIFQFSDDRLVPDIDRVLPHLDRTLSPLTVLQWFQLPSPNLVSDDGEAHSPLQWLGARYPLEPVINAAHGLGRGG